MRRKKQFVFSCTMTLGGASFSFKKRTKINIFYFLVLERDMEQTLFNKMNEQYDEPKNFMTF
jgi:hypothetical protein